MGNPYEHPTALQDLQDSIYREKVLRARAMTPEERFDSGFELTNASFKRMLEGAMWQARTTCEEEGRRMMIERLARLRKADELGRYSDSR